MKRFFLFGMSLFFCMALSISTMAQSVDDILAKVEARYAQSGFTADFSQTTTIKSLGVSDTASGKMWIQRPDKIRWEYQKPELQTIVSNGTTVWIYKPADNQVFQGKSEALFGGGKGGMFLSNPKLIREHYYFSLDEPANNSQHVLKLLPKQKTNEASLVLVTVSKTNYTILQLTTFTASGEQTTIDLKNIVFTNTIDSSRFQFTVPKGVDVIQLNASGTK